MSNKHTTMVDKKKEFKVTQIYTRSHHFRDYVNKHCDFTPDTVECLRSMFQEVKQAVYRHKPNEFENFLDYGFLLYQFMCKLDMELPPFLKENLRRLKEEDRLGQQELWWRQACVDIKWLFIEIPVDEDEKSDQGTDINEGFDCDSDVTTEEIEERGVCCYCQDECNPCSQACGRCMRDRTMISIGMKRPKEGDIDRFFK